MKVVRSDSSDASADEIAISSEYEVVRNGWFGDRWVEVLDHTKAAVVMERAQHGLALLREHTPDGLIGRVENIRIDSDKVLRGTIKWSRNDAGQNAKRDFDDGILPDVSVGYRIHEYTLERSDKDTNTEYYRVTRWEPLEASLVAIPADPTVGKGRAVDDGAAPQTLTPPVVTKEVRMADTNAPTAQPVAEVRERSNATELAKLAESNNMLDKLPGWIERNVTTIQALDETRAAIRERAKIVEDIDSGSRDPLANISPKERKDFSVVRCIAAALDNRLWEKAGFEREVQQEFAKQGVTARNGASFIVPSHYGWGTRAAGQLDTATTLQGQQLVFDEPGSFIELFRNYAALLRLGARQLTGLTGNVAFPRQTGAGTAYWTGEAPTADVTASNLTVDLLELSPKTLMSQTRLSRQLAHQAASAQVGIEALVRRDIAMVHALEIDRIGINGSGSNNEPLGLLPTAAGLSIRTLGTNGAVPTYDHVIDMLTDLAVANAPDAAGVLTTPGVAGKLMKTQKFASTNGEPVWTGSFRDGLVGGVTGVATNQVPSNLTKGTATTVCHAMIAGDFSELIFAEWGGFEIQVETATLLGRNMYRLVSYQTADIGIRHAAAFVKTVDARTS